MSEELQLDQNTLVNVWQQELPEYLNPGDSAQVQADAADPKGLRVHINAAGRQFYSFDFYCSYLDQRELQVNLVDVEQDGVTVDEGHDVIQEMTAHYVRNIHECGQALQRYTNP
ncbi:hypothetical protein D3C81_1084090 [compost metagenome]